MASPEDTSLEPQIGWLAETILGTLQIEKLDTWIRRAELDDVVQKLKSEVERVEMVVAAVRGRATGNKPLSRSLARLKDLLYDADDAVDELDYYRLQQQVERDPIHNPESTHGAEAERVDETSRGAAAAADIPNSSGGHLRSKHWKDFTVITWESGKAVEAKCNLCGAHPIKCGSGNGTSVLSNHLKSKGCIRKRRGPPNPSSTDDATEIARPIVIGDSSSGKRKRADHESSKFTATNTDTPWDKAELSNRIQKITSQLQDIRGKVSEILKIHGPDFPSSSNNHRIAASDHHLRTTSSLAPRKVYGRVAEKKAIIKMIMQNKSNGVTVLPIVGTAGVGKTTLAQLVYNDPDVESHFDTKLWLRVSHNFDEVRLTREMLDFVPQDRCVGSLHINERHEGISSFAKLQEILKERMEYQLKRFLLILDDVWDNLDDERWNKLLNPLISSQAKGNVILVTTRNFCVAKKKGTLEPIQLCALEDEDFLLLFKSRAFGDENYKGDPSLSLIGRQIAEKLAGNPLAAETAGELLREHLTIDHWTKILKDEHWKSLQLSTGIMCALRLSYDQLPYHIQQCFSYTSIFPRSYRFPGEMLVHIWISQGFVNGNQSSKRLEEIGRHNLTVLVNLGFIQQVEIFLSCQPCYAICGLMHHFGRIVSRTECAIIDGLQCNEMLPTVLHLSIVTDYAYNKDQDGEFSRNELFEKTLNNTVTSVSKLRSLVLLGHYDPCFLQLFQRKFQEAQNLRLLQMSVTSVDFSSFQCSFVKPAHLRYLKLGSVEVRGDFPRVFSKLYQLQVLDVGLYAHPTAPNGIHNLVSLRLLDFKVQTSSGSEITQLQSMNELVQLGVSQLDNVKSSEEAYGAGLRNKGHLENLHLSWKDTLSDNESPADTARKHSEVLEGLKPHKHLKHLQISGYNGTSPTWLNSNMSITSLQTLHLDCCREWEILPSLERFPCLRKLKLNNMRKVTKILVPSLEELVLVDMPELERCSCTSLEGFNSSLRSLRIENCEKLEVFDLFENAGKFKVEHRSWLSGVRELILLDCHLLKVFSHLPPSATFSELQIRGVSTLPSMNGSYEKLHIESDWEDPSTECVGEVLAFHNLRSLKFLSINGYGVNSMSIFFKDLSHLVSLKSLEIARCGIVFSSYVIPEPTCEDVLAANRKLFPSLQSLTVESCRITGKGLSLMLQHSPVLEKLDLFDCIGITLLTVDEEENSLSNLISDRETQDELLHIPFNVSSTLKELSFVDFHCLRFNGSKKGFSGFTSLENLHIWDCPELLSSLVRKDGSDDQANGRWLLPESLGELDIVSYPEESLQRCFPNNLNSLKKLVLWNADLKSLQLHSCTGLEELEFAGCDSLSIVEGLQSLGSLRDLTVLGCPCLPSYLESFSRQCNELLPRLETLVINDPGVLTTSFCKHLTSLHDLKLVWMKVTRLTEEQERALVLLKSLQELTFDGCHHVMHLPAGLHTLPSLKRLKIDSCSSILWQPETGFPDSLEELELLRCSKELDDECMLLATPMSKLKVKIIP
ncbi:putative disease resistance protein RGA4 [Brachypodium distachyon]|uniref:BED-type domain-containing protein n=1 Tax=Brachypodium distachyon TaxID=15368 RepID=A0A0Q3H8W7_BRADI|nr:putative disease resistance protein RGA4 [Brachypodium distachyon]KQJ84667.1 hypothetical protein BRADI_5g22146v3 [Brachypodium distachyon]|eukprot:XP_010240444.1 putative disease resistance protein RGA4 [Brachypodium distachyon]